MSVRDKNRNRKVSGAVKREEQEEEVVRWAEDTEERERERGSEGEED